MATDLLARVRRRPGRPDRSDDHRGGPRGRPDRDRAARRDRAVARRSASPTWRPPSTPGSSSSAGASAPRATCCSTRRARPSGATSPAAATARRRASSRPRWATRPGSSAPPTWPAGTPLDARRRGRMSTMRVASYNLKDFTLDRHAAARVVRAIDPDVLCLQEVPRRLAVDLAGVGLRGRVRDVLVGPAPRQRRHDDLHLAARAGDRVAAPPAAGGRPAAHPGVCRDPGRVPRVTSRSWWPRCTSASTPTSASGTPARSSRRVSGGGPVLLAGDLNEGETGRAWRLFAAPMRLVSPTTPTYPAKAPRKVLDVIFASPDLRVLPHREVPLDEADLVAASDHRPDLGRRRPRPAGRCRPPRPRPGRRSPSPRSRRPRRLQAAAEEPPAQDAAGRSAAGRGRRG